jgi:SAM-dependent methyltransferase
VHQSSFDKMTSFCRDYLEARSNEPLTIIDLGSHDINGCYRSLFARPPWRYIGVDLAPGPNVDLVLRDPYHWREIKTESADVIVAGQTFEHTEFFWETMLEISRALKAGGLCCVVVPSSGPEHRFPVDCWRMLPDGLDAMARYGGLDVIEARTQWEDLPQYDSESNKWHDSVLIARKPKETSKRRWQNRVGRWALRCLRNSRSAGGRQNQSQAS